MDFMFSYLVLWPVTIPLTIGLYVILTRPRPRRLAVALFGAIPLLGPLVALLLLGRKRITIDPVPTSRHGMTALVFATILIGNMWGTLVERIETSEAPNRKTRLLIAAPPVWDQNYRFELQHLSGPLITAAERIYTSPDEVRMLCVSCGRPTEHTF
jgi:hypothetical protein